MIDRIISAVEIEWLEARLFAETTVERDGGLDPAAFEKEFVVAVVVEDVGAHPSEEFLGREVIANVGVPESAGNSRRAANGGQEAAFGDAPTEATFEHRAGAEVVGSESDAIRRIPDLIANGVEQAAGAVDLRGAVRRLGQGLFRERNHGRRLAFNVPRRRKIRRQIGLGRGG